jgi:DnaJ-class molecular chaperone
MRFSNDTCSKKFGDGTLCNAALFGILENQLVTCSACNGTGKLNSSKCDVCEGYGYEFREN